MHVSTEIGLLNSLFWFVIILCSALCLLQSEVFLMEGEDYICGYPFKYLDCC